MASTEIPNTTVSQNNVVLALIFFFPCCFLVKSKENPPKKARNSLLRIPKIPGKEGQHSQKRKESPCNETSKEIQKARKGRSGCFCVWGGHRAITARYVAKRGCACVKQSTKGGIAPHRESFKVIFSLAGYFYFARLFLETLQKYPLKQA